MNNTRQEIRVGILRVNKFVLLGFITKFFTGQAKFINKNLKLRNVRKSDSDDLPMSLPYYDFVFEGDDLPIVPEGCWPLFVTEERVEGEEHSYRLVEDKRNVNK